jgi:hypothetical protein
VGWGYTQIIGLSFQTICSPQTLDADHDAREEKAAQGRCDQQNTDQTKRAEDDVRERRLVDGLLDDAYDNRRRLLEHLVLILRLLSSFFRLPSFVFQYVAFFAETAFILLSPCW